MNKKQARQYLLNYLSVQLRVKARPDEPIAVTLEQIADFCDLLRRGCKQDMERLILRAIKDSESSDGARHLRALGEGIHGGGEIEVWGLPDCECDQVECVYCGPRIAERATSKQEISGEGPIPSGQSSESESVDKNAS